MRLSSFSIILAAVFLCPRGLFAKSTVSPESVAVPGIDPLSAPALTMTPDQLEEFFNHLKKGMPVQLTLEKGKVIQGLFSSYDDYYQTIWIVPRQGEKGVFSQNSYKLSGVSHAAIWNVKEASPSGFSTLSDSTGTAGGFGSGDYYLLKQDGQ